MKMRHVKMARCAKRVVEQKVYLNLPFGEWVKYGALWSWHRRFKAVRHA